MSEQIFPILATIILVATLITLIVAVVSYLIFRLKEKKRSEENISSYEEIVGDESETGAAPSTPVGFNRRAADQSDGFNRRAADAGAGGSNRRNADRYQGSERRGGGGGGPEDRRGGGGPEDRRGGERGGDGRRTHQADHLFAGTQYDRRAATRSQEPVEGRRGVDQDDRRDRRRATEYAEEEFDRRERRRGAESDMGEDPSRKPDETMEFDDEPEEVMEEEEELSSAQSAFMEAFKSNGGMRKPKKPAHKKPKSMQFRQFSVDDSSVKKRSSSGTPKDDSLEWK